MLIFLTIFVITVAHYSTPAPFPLFHAIYRRLYYIPIIFAAINFGMKGGILASLIVSIFYIPHIFEKWGKIPLQTYEALTEIILYNVVAYITAYFVELQRNIRREKEKLLDKIRQTEKYITLGEVASIMTHEIKTPLATISGAIEIIESEADLPEDKKNFCKIINKEIVRIDNIINNTFAVFKSERINKQKIDLSKFITEIKNVILLLPGMDKISFKINNNSQVKNIFIDVDLFKEIELVHHIQNALKSTQLELENLILKNRLSSYELQEMIIGKSLSIKRLREIIKDVAESDVNVFISGETGTGKELVAKAIHKNSVRAGFPFVAVNCAAIPENLLESELFGYVKGAFTGAIKDKKGKFEIANNGTIFLDEITEMSYHLQAKLLRVIQEKEIEPVGSARVIKINVRFISASNKDVEREIQNGNFREDLFYRLNIFLINVPPLREHKEDIPLLIQHFARKNNYGNIQITKQALKKLMDYNWPGNVRELENVLHYAIVNSKKGEINITHLPEKILNFSDIKLNLIDKPKTLAEYEREIILNALAQNKGNQTKTARQLGITRAVLIYKMKKLGIKPLTDYRIDD